MIAKAKGLAVLSVIKAGFLVTARGGSGIVLARLPDGSKLVLVETLNLLCSASVVDAVIGSMTCESAMCFFLKCVMCVRKQTGKLALDYY